MTARTYLTTAIPYVNAPPHLGHALELVQADALARHHRRRDRAVRLLTGTDEYAPKNAVAAAADGTDVATFVARNAARFRQLCAALDISHDDFLRTSADARHQPAVEALWARCAAAGDLVRRPYRGRYCPGCEQFVTDADLVDGRCAEHGIAPDEVEEQNWFFRSSRHAPWLRELVSSGTLRIVPEHRRNEVLGVLDAGLDDFSVSRPVARSRGWGVPVPGDASQTVYVWFDALANYVSALGYGGADDELFRTWWTGANERVHLVGKGIVRFHALHWPAILRAAGLPPPTTIAVHDYVTVDGAKIGKSLGNAVDPCDLVARLGVDALRWWVLHEVPTAGDVDFTEARLVGAADRDLANGVGNLVHRVTGLVRRVGPGVGGPSRDVAGAADLASAAAGAPAAVDRALRDFAFRRALDALLDVVDVANRTIDTTRPWELAAGGRRDEAAALVGALVDACRVVGDELTPFVPRLSSRIAAVLDGDDRGDRPVFPRLAAR
jgi:methionyl-tRNA synthetase